MVENLGEESKKIIAIMDAIVKALKEGRSCETVLSAEEFRAFIIGGFKVFGREVEEKYGIKIAAPKKEQVKLTITKGQRVALDISNLSASKKVALISIPIPIPINVKADAVNSGSHPKHLFLFNIKTTDIPGIDLKGKISSKIGEHKLNSFLAHSLSNEFKPKGVMVESIGLRIKPNNTIWFHAQGRRLK